MGVLCQFQGTPALASLRLDGSERSTCSGLKQASSRDSVTLVIHRKSGAIEEIPITLRIDTPIEVDYYKHGGILPYVLRQLLLGTTEF